LSGVQNTADGVVALSSNIDGSDNSAFGWGALTSNTTGSENTAVGSNALAKDVEGSNNTAIGSGAGANVQTASDVICIGAGVYGADVGNTCFIGSIRDVETQNADAIPVLIDSAGQLGTAGSSAKFKKEIKPMDKASEAILALQPVTFQYKKDKIDIPQFGLIAEEVAKVNPNLVVRDKNGEIYTVRYDAVNAMLLNEFLKEHRKVDALQASFAQQRRDFQATVAQQQKQIEAVTAGLQKVSSQLETINPVRQVANTNR
jgi:hypothetical protein